MFSLSPTTPIARCRGFVGVGLHAVIAFGQVYSGIDAIDGGRLTLMDLDNKLLSIWGQVRSWCSELQQSLGFSPKCFGCNLHLHAF